jgi:hypothetical protein
MMPYGQDIIYNIEESIWNLKKNFNDANTSVKLDDLSKKIKNNMSKIQIRRMNYDSYMGHSKMLQNIENRKKNLTSLTSLKR